MVASYEMLMHMKENHGYNTIFDFCIYIKNAVL